MKEYIHPSAVWTCISLVLGLETVLVWGSAIMEVSRMSHDQQNAILRETSSSRWPYLASSTWVLLVCLEASPKLSRPIRPGLKCNVLTAYVQPVLDLQYAFFHKSECRDQLPRIPASAQNLACIVSSLPRDERLASVYAFMHVSRHVYL